MSKLVYVIVYCLLLLPASLLFSPKALAQSVGLRECDESLRLYTFNPVSKILKASLSLSPRGYLLNIQEENKVQVFGLTDDLNYYYSSNNLFRLEGVRPAKIASDGSFRLILPMTLNKGCTFTGKLAFETGAREKLFPRTDPTATCRSAISLAEMRLMSIKNVYVHGVEKFPHNYRDYPSGRRFVRRFILLGSATPDVIASPVLLTSISTNIISNCKDVGIVKFGQYRTDYIRTYGLLRNNKVKPFQCVDAAILGRGDTRQQLSWGQTDCI
jgi:hypothetical protein